MAGELTYRLDLWGIQRPLEVVELAAAARLEVACAATLLERESSGGRNVWGRDPVDDGGVYAKGGEVTRAAYEAYRAQRDRLGAQGVGPCQLTHPSLQNEADRRGGCWDWRSNVAVGFEHLAGLQRSYGMRDGFRRYNGSGPAAEQYADRAVEALARWRTRLGDATATIGPSALPTLRAGDTSSQVRALQRFAARAFPGYPGVGALPATGFYGPQTTRWVAEFQRRSGVTGPDADGTVVGPRTLAALWVAGFRG